MKLTGFAPANRAHEEIPARSTDDQEHDHEQEYLNYEEHCSISPRFRAGRMSVHTVTLP